MMVALPELDLELDASEERRRRPEHELVATRLEVASRARRCDRRRPSRRTRRPRFRRASSTRTPAAGFPAAVSRTCVETEARHADESSRLHPMGTCDLGLVGVDERSSAHDVLALDDESVDAMRCGEHEPCDRVVRAAELERVRAPDGEVGALARLERADVVPAEHRCAAARAEPAGLRVPSSH